MKNLISHLYKEHANWIAAKSLKNCHAVGVDSIMFIDQPEYRVRLFIANANHTLWKNTDKNNNMSVAFHSHHCNITLVPVTGKFINWRAEEILPFALGKVCLYDSSRSTENGKCFQIKKFEYQSKIKEGECRFKLMSSAILESKGQDFCKYDSDPVKMKAKELHTVYVNEGETAAWFVFEGKSDPKYQSHCYSWNNLEQFDASNLYQPITKNEVKKHLINLDLIE